MTTIDLDDVKKIASKFRIAQKQFLKDVYEQNLLGGVVCIPNNRVNRLVLEKFTYDIIFLMQSGLTIKTTIIESFFELKGFLYIYPNKSFLVAYGELLKEEEAQQAKLREIEEEELIGSSEPM